MDLIVSLSIVAVLVGLTLMSFRIANIAAMVEQAKERLGNLDTFVKELPVIMIAMSERIKVLADRDRDQSETRHVQGRQFYVISDGPTLSTYVINKATGQRWNNVISVDLHAQRVDEDYDPMNVAQAQIMCGYELGLDPGTDIKYFMLRANGHYQELRNPPEAFWKWFFEEMKEDVVDPDGQGNEVPA